MSANWKIYDTSYYKLCNPSIKSAFIYHNSLYKTFERKQCIHLRRYVVLLINNVSCAYEIVVLLPWSLIPPPGIYRLQVQWFSAKACDDLKQTVIFTLPMHLLYYAMRIIPCNTMFTRAFMFISISTNFLPQKFHKNVGMKTALRCFSYSLFHIQPHHFWLRHNWVGAGGRLNWKETQSSTKMMFLKNKCISFF